MPAPFAFDLARLGEPARKAALHMGLRAYFTPLSAKEAK